ncbi:hypothetical protein LSH36_207g05036 [Paralvinella palmiformis]|uniref:poly(A)-specific ribonuclease n=1 Tax=Paralvinella palmiformis TaxID=53620 RepID=A0AAD9N4D6_9ANNE|nr:hypothetical protein LSH36_207g05036 [Paralvinella palmiformis]
MGSLEVVSKETFQQQLEGMSSCVGCQKERLKDVTCRKLTRHSRKGNHVKSNSPIVVRLRDTIKVSVKGKIRDAVACSDIESDISSDDESSGTTSAACTSSTSQRSSTSSPPPESPREHVPRKLKGIRTCRMRRSQRNGKNFNAFLSAIEKVHSKERGFHLFNNLSQEYNWHSKEYKNPICGLVPHSNELLLNNAMAAYQSSINSTFLRNVTGVGSTSHCHGRACHHVCPKPKAFQTINKNKIDLICNDLSSDSPSCDSTASVDESEYMSVCSSADSLSESEASSIGDPVPEELSKEELEKLAEFAAGCPLKRYTCPPHQCPECLAAYYAYVQYYAHSADLLKAGTTEKAPSPSAKNPSHPVSRSYIASHNTSGAAEVSASDSKSRQRPDENTASKDKPKHVEVSVAWFFEKPARKTSMVHCDEQQDTVTVDITDSNITFSVCYPSSGTDDGNIGSNGNGQYDYGGMTAWPNCYDFYHNFYTTMLGFVPFLIPAYWVPPLYHNLYPPLVIHPHMSFKDITFNGNTFKDVTFRDATLKPGTFDKNSSAFKDITKCLSSNQGTQTQEDYQPLTANQPPQRPWIPLAHPDTSQPVAIFTVMCYNVLCDKYATRQLYGYCPSWALNWEYRKKIIIEEIRQYSADIISLQEVETEQFYNYFLPELKANGYDGVFAPKSRARTMAETERKHVDGCAIFYQTARFNLVKDYLVEFNQLAISTAEGSHDMINRVMTKDNIGLAALLETKSSVWENGLPSESQIKQPILVATCHVHWDPEFCDVKLIQTMMLMSELKNIIQDTQTSLRPGSSTPDCNTIPLILCGDLNSLPQSGVVDFLNIGKVSAKHEDFKGLGYEDCLRKLSISDNKDMFDFKGIIDYIFYSRDFMRPLGLLGPLDQEWFRENKVFGCPHPQIPSDHLPLLTEFEMAAHVPSSNSSNENNENSHHSNVVSARR